MKNDEILTVKETAALLKTTRQQIRKMIANEELPAVKVGREWRVLKAGIMEFLRRIYSYTIDNVGSAMIIPCSLLQICCSSASQPSWISLELRISLA